MNKELKDKPEAFQAGFDIWMGGVFIAPPKELQNRGFILGGLPV